VKRPGANHIDRRRRLRPRDYLWRPHEFGHDPSALFRMPLGGDPVSQVVARVQHHLVIAYRAAGPTGSGSRDARLFGISTSTWSRSMIGERWLGETVMAAVLRRLRGW
jgi:hypothetical protein